MSSSVSDLGSSFKNLDIKKDWAKPTLTTAVLVVVLIKNIQAWLTYRRLMKKIEKSIEKGGLTGVSKEAIPPELLKNIAVLGGLSPLKVALVVALTIAFLIIMNVMP